nr:hypothetical protein [Tanacetum cinerariifolium]
MPPSLDSSYCKLAELRTNCDREHSKVLELEDQLQGKDKTIRNLQAQHDIVSLLNVGPTDGRKALETDLAQLKDTITALRIQNDGFKVINATQKTEIFKLKAKDVGNKSSETTTPTNLKVLALGMYAIGTPKPSPRVTKKPIAPQVKKDNIVMHLSIGIKSATGASKTASKNHAWIYRKLPAKSTSGEKVKDHPRNLNKQNHVDSHFNTKRLVSISNLNAVCGACQECLFSFSHDKYVVYSMNSVKPKATPNRQTTKKVWKQKVVAHAKPQWMPTGRHFTLYDSYPLTRILDPMKEPLELSLSVSSSLNVTMFSRFANCQLSNRKAGSKGISAIFE